MPGRSRRHSATAATKASAVGKFRHDLTTSKEMELSRQTDSLIDRAMTTVDRAVRRKEKLVSRMAAERERRQLTSRPLASPTSLLRSAESSGRPEAHAAHHPAALGPGSYRTGSKRLQERARGLRAKLDERRKALRQVTALAASRSIRWDTTHTPTPGASSAAGPTEADASFIGDGPAVPISPSDSALIAVTTQRYPQPAAGLESSDATLSAMQDMTSAVQGVAASISGLQVEQEAIVDLLIAVLAEGDDDS